LRYFPTTLFAAALAFALAAPAGAAPSSINDCEKIEAADAYNQCLALFGPVAHTHGASAKDFGGDGASGGADIVETTNPEDSVPQKTRYAAHGRHAHGHQAYGHASRHSHRQHYGHNYGRRHGQSSAHVTHGRNKKLAFNVVSGHAKKH
jgi:hypothetical protein